MEGSFYTLFLVIVALLFTYWFVFHRGLARVLYLTRKIRGPSTWELLTVHARHLLNNGMLLRLWHLSENYGYKTWGMWLFADYVAFASDPQTVSEIFKIKSLYDKPTVMYEFVSKHMGTGLIHLNGPQYQLHRKIVKPTFRKTALESNLDRVNEEADALINEFRAKATGESVDIRSIIDYRAFTVAVSIFSSNSYYPERQLTEKLMKGIRDCMYISQLRMTNPFYYWFVFKFKKISGEMEHSVQQAIDLTRQEVMEQIRLAVDEELESSDKQATNLKDAFHQAWLQEDVITEEEIFAEVRTILCAAWETSSYGMNIVLLILALHPEIQQKVFKELESIFGQSDRGVESEDLAQMVYMDNVIKEAYRLFPPVPIIGRNVKEETTIDDVTLPKGSTLFINICALHRNPDSFKDPLKFDPDRFLPENSKGRHPYAYLPFSTGYRICPGNLQAMIVVKTVLCHVLRNFKVLPGEKLRSMDDIKIEMQFVMHLPGSSLRFVRREN